MQFLLPGMRPALERWKSKAIHPQAPKDAVPSPFHDLMEVTMAQEEPGEPEENGAFRKLSDAVLHYEVFGPRIGETCLEHTPVREGDTIGLAYRFLPYLRLFFASRVVHVFENELTENGWRTGFVYQTLIGHPELGEEIFEVIKLREGPVMFRLEAWSRPNLWFVKLFTPWARLIQKRAAHCAREYLAQKL